MSSVSSIIEVYKMAVLSPITRVKIMCKLGKTINDELSQNLTQDIVAELVKTLPVNKQDVPEAAKWLGELWEES